MILHHHKVKQSSLSFHTKLKYSDTCSFIPISLSDTYAIQTPSMYAPYGICTADNNKRYVDITFYNKENDTEVSDFLKSLTIIYKVIKKKYDDRYHVNPFLKQTQFNESMRLKVDQNALFFNHAKQKIDSIQSNYYGRYLISLHGLWIINHEIWIQWILIQGKMIEPVRFKNLLIDEIILPISKKPIPPPPPLPIFKKSDHKIKIIKNSKKANHKGKQFEVPSIEELQIILSNLKNIHLF